MITKEELVKISEEAVIRDANEKLEKRLKEILNCARVAASQGGRKLNIGDLDTKVRDRLVDMGFILYYRNNDLVMMW